MTSRRLLPASLIAAALATACAAPAGANVLITIDKSTQHMTVAVDGATRYVWPVSTGRGGYVTPSGSFKPFRMEAEHYSKEWDDAPMPHSIFFTKIGHAIHGTLEAKNLGRAASHGCVRLSTANASTLYALVKAKGMSATSVVVTGHNPSQNAPVARRRPPAVEAVEAEPPAGYAPPGYGPPGYAPPGYGQSYYRQPYYGQPSYQPPPGYPPQPPAYQPQYYRPYTSY
jgi:hypothetical protein